MAIAFSAYSRAKSKFFGQCPEQIGHIVVGK
jgi:hypothetical protein